ncbi:nuclear factor erythroid 2-related factor 2a isoform X2 [Betta splendens]|uniref:Nuclear factor erythroid 2-related factor 2a isoform X2 n=1 Tax=Betta splendens TaxID=158456 RepID=A0A6P7LFB7_BETSP|nr:nuclear factor erythroid 2-related factor 2a isoform X2 [Betta splendens]
MMMEMEVMHSNPQDMELIDILWNQDIDLGARREVFDYNHRQKEHELQRQRELEEEKRLHLLREQEKAQLAQLQLDEETGEYIPRPAPAAAPLGASQNVSFPDDGEAMSFDECLQLLAETFPVEEAENTSVPGSSNTMAMTPEQPALPSAPQTMTPDLEQAWMELLSLPELQCLNMQMEETLETTYPLPNNPEVQDPNFPFYPVTSLPDRESNTLTIAPGEFMNTFDGSIPTMAPSDRLSRVEANAPLLNTNFGAESFCDIFYPGAVLEESSAQRGVEDNDSDAMSDVPSQPSFTTMDLYSLSPGDEFDGGKHSVMAETPDSDSGISANTSPNGSSPDKSAYSDSEMEEMDHNPGSVESEYSEMFSLNFQPDDHHLAIFVSAPTEPMQQEKKPKQHKAEPAEDGGPDDAPFTKDKQRKRSDARLSRDEQKAKSLKVPFSVDMIINLPVDDFNEMMSKHQLNEAQLALVRDIRRRGKNKVAAQNCRKRKMENIVGLEHELDSLKDERARLRSERSRNAGDLKAMKKQLSSLYLEVFAMLRDEEGNSYSPSEYSLQQSADGTIFLVPRVKKTVRRENNHFSSL